MDCIIHKQKLFDNNRLSCIMRINGGAMDTSQNDYKILQSIHLIKSALKIVYNTSMNINIKRDIIEKLEEALHMVDNQEES